VSKSEVFVRFVDIGFNEPGSLHGRKRGRMYSGTNIRTKQIYLKRRQCEEEF
jgi:hypothetical protein